MTNQDTALADRVVSIAQRLIQERGYSGFTVWDVAKAASVELEDVYRLFLHKDDMAAEVAQRYHLFYTDLMEEMIRTLEPAQCLRSYADRFSEVVDEGRLCLCGVIASESANLPEKIAAYGQTIQAFHRQWLARVIERGQETGVFLPSLNPEVEALVLFATFEGAMMMARNEGNASVFRVVAERSLSRLMKPGAAKVA